MRTKFGNSNDALIQEGVSLQPYNTLAVPARAAFFSRCTTLDQLVSALTFAKHRELQVIVLGEGSNTVLSENLCGLVILNRLAGIDQIKESAEDVLLRVAAGENWHEFVQYSLNNGWYGLENLALIPGLVGAAPIQNIGAYGVEVKETIESVDYIDLESGQTVTLTNAECQFAYRDSIFKRGLLDKVVITSVVFRLSKSAEPNLSYPVLAEAFRKPPSPYEIFDVVCKIRASKLPIPDEIPNAGSFFKNPVVDHDVYVNLKKSFPSIVAFPTDRGVKLAAAWMIEQQGWKDKSMGAVYVHRDQALVIVNPNSKSGEAVLALALAIQDDIQRSFGITLEIEPRIY